MPDFKKEELLSFSKVIPEILEVLKVMSPEKIVELYNKLTNDYTEIKYKKDHLFHKTVYNKIDSTEVGSGIVIGTFYELGNGEITKTYGSNSVKRTISHYFDGHENYAVTLYPDTRDWKKRDDLKDFPDSKDPRLPYVFDLFWDIKQESELKKLMQEFSYGSEDYDSVMYEIRKVPHLRKKFLEKKQ